MRALLRQTPPLLVLLAFLGGGCGVFGDDEPEPTPTPTATATATATSTPTSTPTPVPQLETASLDIAEGSSVVLRVRGAGASGVATFDDREYTLVPMQGGFWAVLGVGAQEPIGSYTVCVTLSDRAGTTVAQLSGTVTVSATGYPVEQIYVPPDESGLLDPSVNAREQATRSAVYAQFTAARLWEGPFILPVNGPISSPYGIARSYNGGPVSSFHTGADFAEDEGTPVIAANSGRVAFVGALPIRGNSVIIDHGAGVFSGYHHLKSTTVTQGQSVAKGDLIGYLGGTGLATGPHLHWEITVNGVQVNPVLWTYEEVGP